jgi:hypothetical protein
MMTRKTVRKRMASLTKDAGKIAFKTKVLRKKFKVDDTLNSFLHF